jgi:isopropylmalate/isohomocitrate dehydrogenase-like protein
VNRKIVVLPGDGIGPEVTQAALYALSALNIDLEPVICEVGYDLWKRTGNQLPEDVIDKIKEVGICLKGPTTTPPGPGFFRSVVVTLRQTFDLYANMRPVRSRKGVPALYPDLDFVIVRENTEGLYKGIEYNLGDVSMGVRVISRRGSERIARFAFDLAERENRKKVTTVHKANVCRETDGLFRSVCIEMASKYPGKQLEEMLIDAAALNLVMKPSQFDVIVTTNLFGDILSDLSSGLVGGLGMAPGASIGDRYAMFEPVHGSAPNIAGKKIANPSAMTLSTCLMLRHLGYIEAADKLEGAIDQVLAEGRVVTPDLGGQANTMEMTEEIVRKLR